MGFTEKLRRLAAGINKSKASQSVGLKPNTISTYIATGNLPRVDIALKMARALEIPLDWLADDAQDGEPPKLERPSLQSVSDDDLMHEVARRHRHIAIGLLADLDRFTSIDWKRAADDLERTSNDHNPSAYVAQAIAILSSLEVRFARLRHAFDVDFYAVLHHSELPGGDRPIQSLDRSTIDMQFQAVEGDPDVERFMRVLSTRKEWQQSRERNELMDIRLADMHVSASFSGDNLLPAVQEVRKRLDAAKKNR